ncbi:MAG TPA: DUF1177 domain-containing protein [bacterium]|nr:DUF1177 domain-containing protein [bacterium]
MALKQTLEIMELVDSARASGGRVAELLKARGLSLVTMEPIRGPRGATEFLTVAVPGTAGKLAGGAAPTLGVVGRLGGLGARPERIGLVSDGDGAVTALAVALKLADMAREGDRLVGDVHIATHVCPNAPTQPHEPVPFMGSPVDMRTMNQREVDPAMDAVLSVDTTRGNRIVNRRGVAISPTVKEGYVLRVSDDLLDLMQIVTGCPPVVLPITTQDITPYGNGVYHVNSILQPSVATSAPVVGVALTAEVVVPGSATGASQAVDIEQAARFCVEVAKAFGAGGCRFYDPAEYARLLELYGSLSRLQGQGAERRA